MHRVLVLAMLALLAPAVAAQDAPSGHVASFLAYHADGGRDADPLASPLAPPPARADRLPATFFDGSRRADNAPENAPERALAHYREFQRLLLARESVPAGTTISLDATLDTNTLEVRAFAPESVNWTLVLFEQGAPRDGVPQPYVARYVTDAPDAREITRDFPLDAAWQHERLGVVAIARNGDEVLQSATWTLARATPTVQRERAVLVEHVTASWCDPCRPADEAFALLSSQRGMAGPLGSGELQYFHAPGWQLYAGLALGGLVAFALLRRRAA